MNSLRKWLYKPKKTDNTLLAQFYFADEELNLVAAELDSFDGRKDPERCTMLVNQLRVCQDKVLTVIQRIMDDAITGERANRDFRVKFPDDVLQDSLAGQLWFGAECLAAGSSILNREVESASMRPLARALTKNLDSLRGVLRDQCLRSCTEYTERIKEALVIFDKLFAEFELSYVSAMVPVKTMKEYDLLQEVTVLFSETVHRALKESLLSQDMIDYCDPALMFTIPRLAIVCGLLIYPEGPLNPDMEPSNMTEMYRPFQTLLQKIRELLYTLSPDELEMLEKALCSSEEPEVSTRSAVGSQSENLLQIDQGFHEGGEGIVPLESIGSNILVHSPGSGSPVTPVNLMPEGIDFGQLSPTSTIVADYQDEEEIEDGFLNKSESQDSGLQSEIVSTSDTVPAGGLPSVSHDIDGANQYTKSCDKDGATFETVASAKADDKRETEDSNSETFENSCEQTESDNVCDKIDSCEISESNSNWINDQSSVKSCCRVESGSEVRHLCREVVDEIVINAVHYSEGACDTKLDQSDITLCENSVKDDTADVSDQNGVTEGNDGETTAAAPGVSRQFSWQYNVQFALPQLSLTDHDMADRQSSGSFSSDSTVSEDTGQPASVSDFVIETLASMNRTSENNNASAQSDQTVASHSSFSSQRSSSSKDSQKLPSVSHVRSATSKHRKREHHQSGLNKAQTASAHQSTLDKPNTNCNHKVKQGKRDSVENISCGIGAQAQTSVDDLVLGSKDLKADLKAVLTIKTEETASCSSGPSSVGSDCDCDTQCSCIESETSSYNSETNDEEEIALAIQAAEIASRNEARSRFRSSSDLIHRLFVCIAGVADQLQTNYASDLRHILKCVFEMNTESLPEPDNEPAKPEDPSDSDTVPQPSDQDDGQQLPSNQTEDQIPPSNQSQPPSNQSPTHHTTSQHRNSVPASPRRIFDEPPEWVPDEEVERCTACKTPFTFVRRRHHCRNCGKIFCGKCSSTTVPLPHYGHQKPVRVCHRCFLYQVSHFTVSRDF